MLGGHPEGKLLSSSAYPQAWPSWLYWFRPADCLQKVIVLSMKCDWFPTPHQLYYAHCFIEPRYSFRRGTEGISIGPVLIFFPAGSHFQLQATVGYDVEGGSHLGHQGWVSVAVAEKEGAKMNF